MPAWKRMATLVALVAIAAIALYADFHHGRTGMPAATLDGSNTTSNRVFTVTRSDGDLHAGDRVEIADPSTLAAIALRALAVGDAIPVRRLSPLPVRSLVDRVIAPPPRNYVPIFILEALFVALAGLIAARGRSSGSLSLAWFFGLILLEFNPTTPEWPRPLVLAFALFGSSLMVVAFSFAIDFATRVAGDPHVRWARSFRRATYWFGGLAIVSNVGVSFSSLTTASTEPVIAYVALGMLVALALAFIVALGFAYANAPAADRRRVIWVAASLALGVVGFVSEVGCEVANVAEPYRNLLLVLVLAMPLGCAYAILRYRLLDMGFVINRATVFGVTSLLVLAALALVDYGLQTLLGAWIARTGLLVQLALALGIGMATRPLHARVDHVVDDVFFRERHEAERTLRSFARDVAYIDDASIVIERTVATIVRSTHAACSLFTLADDGAAYVARGTSTATTATIARNDGAIVRLRATRAPVELLGVASELCGDIAFPMFSRDRLVGVVVCANRTNGIAAYAPDETAAIGDVVHTVGLALDTLHVDALQRELAAFRSSAAVRQTSS